MHITQRQAVLTLFTLQVLAAAGAVVYFTFFAQEDRTRNALLIGLPIFIALLISYQRGWDFARYINVIIATLLVSGPIVDPLRATSFAPVVFAPAVIALMLAETPWIIGTGVVVIASMLIRGGGRIYGEPDFLISYIFVIGGMVVGRLLSDSTLRWAHAALRQAEAERETAGHRAAEITQQAAELEQRNTEQRRLLELVQTLETPTIALSHQIMLAPLIGQMDQRRIADITNRLLNDVATRRTSHLVIDLSGASGIHEGSAQSLAQMVQALQLLGCHVVISGISASTAINLTNQSLRMANVQIVRSPQEALETFSHR